MIKNNLNKIVASLLFLSPLATEVRATVPHSREDFFRETESLSDFLEQNNSQIFSRELAYVPPQFRMTWLNIMRSWKNVYDSYEETYNILQEAYNLTNDLFAAAVEAGEVDRDLLQGVVNENAQARAAVANTYNVHNEEGRKLYGNWYSMWEDVDDSDDDLIPGINEKYERLKKEWDSDMNMIQQKMPLDLSLLFDGDAQGIEASVKEVMAILNKTNDSNPSIYRSLFGKLMD